MHDLFCQSVICFTYEGGGGCHACLRQRSTISTVKVSAWDYLLPLTTSPPSIKKKKKKKNLPVDTGPLCRRTRNILHCSTNHSHGYIGWLLVILIAIIALPSAVGSRVAGVSTSSVSVLHWRLSTSENWVLCHVRALHFGCEHCKLGECFRFFSRPF